MWRYFMDVAKNNPFGSPLYEVQCQPKAALSEVDLYRSESGSAKYYALCALGGATASGTSHLLLAPLDLIKCRMQVDPGKYKSLGGGIKTTVAEEGALALMRGWAPAVLGYAFQGTGKFGLYEVFKIFYSSLLGEEKSYIWRSRVHMISAASAEFFADIVLAPMEATKIRVQTIPGFPTALREAIPHIYREEGLKGFYKGLVPLWMRQIPYSMLKFSSFEKTIELLYKHVVPKAHHECSKAEHLVITFIAGSIVGIFCAIATHPADTLVSKLNKEKGSSALEVLKKIRMADLWKGLGVRIILIGSHTAIQWLVYDSVKVLLKLPRPPPPEIPESLKKKLWEKT